MTPTNNVQWDTSNGGSCKHVYISGYSSTHALTNGTSSSDDICVYSFVTEENVNTYNGYTASMQVFNGASTDTVVTKYKINATVTAVPTAQHSNSNYCSDNGLGNNLDDYGGSFKQCINITLSGANSANGMVSDDPIPVTFENAPVHP